MQNFWIEHRYNLLTTPYVSLFRTSVICLRILISHRCGAAVDSYLEVLHLAELFPTVLACQGPSPDSSEACSSVHCACCYHLRSCLDNAIHSSRAQLRGGRAGLGDTSKGKAKRPHFGAPLQGSGYLSGRGYAASSSSSLWPCNCYGQYTPCLKSLWMRACLY